MSESKTISTPNNDPENKVFKTAGKVTITTLILSVLLTAQIPLLSPYMLEVYREMGVELPMMTQLLIGKELICCCIIAVFPLFSLGCFSLVKKVGKIANYLNIFSLLLLVVVIAMVQLGYFLPLKS